MCSMLLMGPDGLGLDLARKLESLGVWREWLGESLYPCFSPSLSSPSSWEQLMKDDDELRSTAEIHLKLRVRALLFDKAALSLSLTSLSHNTTAAAVTKLNPNYLQLHGDDVYFTLEGCGQDGPQQGTVAGNKTAVSKARSKATTGAVSRYGEKEIDSISQRFRQEEFPESWYDQFFEKYRASYKLPLGDPEIDKRSPEQMATYLRILDNQKRRRVAFKEDEANHVGHSYPEIGSVRNPNSMLIDNDDETYLFPETMFPLNCVPDSALPPVNRVGRFYKVDFNGVLDTLPKIMTKSPIMIERLGIRPEYLSMGQGGNHHGKNGLDGNRKLLSQDQASDISRKVIARLLANVGFEASSEVPMEVLSQLFSCHIRKLGSTLRMLADSYRKECSATELVKMFLQTAGHSNLGALAEIVKDGTRSSVQPTPQQIQAIRSQMQAQQQANLRQPQNLQMARQMHPQLQQMIQSQNPTFQQQQELEQRMALRRRQAPTPRPGMNASVMNNIRPLMEVKLETPSEFPVDNNNPYGTLNARQPQLQQQFRQHPLPNSASVSNFRPQANSQYRQASLPIPQSPSTSMGSVRAQPVKVEGFSELMGGGDSSFKHDAEDNKLTSPTK